MNKSKLGTFLTYLLDYSCVFALIMSLYYNSVGFLKVITPIYIGYNVFATGALLILLFAMYTIKEIPKVNFKYGLVFIHSILVNIAIVIFSFLNKTYSITTLTIISYALSMVFISFFTKKKGEENASI